MSGGGRVAGRASRLAAALAAGDHQKIVALVDECDANGRDLVRLLFFSKFQTIPLMFLS